MANGDKAVSSSVNSNTSGQLDSLPWRQFKDRPTTIWIDEMVAAIKASAVPEWQESLFRNRIPKSARFFILKAEVTINQGKRPMGDRAPLPDVFHQQVSYRI